MGSKEVVPPPPPGFQLIPPPPPGFVPASALPTDRPSTVEEVNPATGTAATGATIGAGDYAALLAKEMGPDLAMVGATMIPGIREATAPIWLARLGRYAAMAEKVYPAAARVAAAGLGRAAGTAGGQAAGIATGAEWAPKTAGQAIGEQAVSGLTGAAQQATFGELIPKVATQAAHLTMTAEKLPTRLEGFKKVQQYRAVQAAEKKIAEAEAARAEQMRKETVEAARLHALDESRDTAEKLVREIGDRYGPNRLQDLAGRLRRQIDNDLEVARKAKYGDLDAIAFQNKEAGAEVVTDGSTVVNKIIEIERRKPRGKGVFRLWTLPEPGVAPVTHAAQQTVKRVGQAEAAVGEAQSAFIKADVLHGDAAEDTKTLIEDLTNAITDLKGAQEAYKEVPLGVSLFARGTVSRALANPDVSTELKGILKEILPDLDNMNRIGLAKIDPKLIGRYEEAKHFWHQSAFVKERVLYDLFKNGRSVKPLTDYIEDNAPRTVEQVRDVLRRTGESETYWPAVQRMKLAELLTGPTGETDLGRFGQKLDDLGTTLPRLARDPQGRIDPKMEARIRELKNLSYTYNKLMEKPTLEVSQRMQHLDNVLERSKAEMDALKKGGPDAIVKNLQYLTAPHVLAGAVLGRVFGWGPALFGGVASHAVQKVTGSAAVKLVKLAENPTMMAEFTKNIEQYARTGRATNLLNVWRIASAGMESRATWEEALASLKMPNLGGVMQPSHTPENLPVLPTP